MTASRGSSSVQVDPILSIKRWLQTVVIGENFCPFAKKEFERQRIRYTLVTPEGLTQLNSILAHECALLDSDENIETTLLIFADGDAGINVEAFEDFLFVIDEANLWMSRNEYEGTYQLATFHPNYLFAGEPEDSASHYTNRSPYPMLHIIRERSIERALKTYKAPESIPQINIARSIELGAAYFEKRLGEALKP